MLGAEDDRQTLDLLLRGFQVSRMLRLVADLFVADKIAADGQISVKELAAACAVMPQPLLRVLRALAALGIFKVGADGSIAHTPKSRLLRTDTPNSMHHAARFWTLRGSWNAWGMLDVAMTGGIPFEAAWDTGRFAYLRAHPDEARVFDAMMANAPDNRHAAFAAAYDFSCARLIVDIGGGNGAALRHILSQFATPRGLVFDVDHVIAAITPDAMTQGRMTAQGGNFFEAVPAGADIYMLIRVLHDWSDEDCVRILRSCRAAMGADARLLLGDLILDPDLAHGRPVSYLSDMAMFGSARERSEAEFRDLLAASGLALLRVIPTTSPDSIIEVGPV